MIRSHRRKLYESLRELSRFDHFHKLHIIYWHLIVFMFLKQSQWNRYFTDTELRSRITQDVIRTFPEIDFFQLPEIQSVMINILFHYARENPSIDYKQVKQFLINSQII
jgi:hypothetical protein